MLQAEAFRPNWVADDDFFGPFFFIITRLPLLQMAFQKKKKKMEDGWRPSVYEWNLNDFCIDFAAM